jgi:hypothetical protein
MTKVSEQQLSGLVGRYLAEGSELMGRLSGDDPQKRDTAELALASWLGRFQVEACKAIRRQKAKRKA